MDEPSVCAVMLTRDRPELARCAVECFRAQTYGHSRLLIYDNGDIPCFKEYPNYPAEVLYHHIPRLGISIGKLRNEAIEFAMIAATPAEFDIVANWDDDDWSHPYRISEQVALLQSSGADCVGYRECLFWRTACSCAVPERDIHSVGCPAVNGEAWLYSNGDKRYCLGTSLCYWRKAWESRPFSEMNGPNPRMRGEDKEFCRGLNCVGVTSIPISVLDLQGNKQELHRDCGPRMICRIHDGNAAQYPLDEWKDSSPHWKRVPQWDANVKETLR